MFGKKKRDTSSIEFFVGKGTKVEGNVTVDGTAIIEGTLSGDIDVKGELIVEEGGKISSDTIRADSFVCSGDVKMKELIANRVELRSTSQLYGNIRYKVLIVEEGAKMVGNITLEGENVQAQSES